MVSLSNLAFSCKNREKLPIGVFKPRVPLDRNKVMDLDEQRGKKENSHFKYIEPRYLERTYLKSIPTYQIRGLSNSNLSVMSRGQGRKSRGYIGHSRMRSQIQKSSNSGNVRLNSHIKASSCLGTSTGGMKTLETLAPLETLETLGPLGTLETLDRRNMNSDILDVKTVSKDSTENVSVISPFPVPIIKTLSPSSYGFYKGEHPHSNLQKMSKLLERKMRKCSMMNIPYKPAQVSKKYIIYDLLKKCDLKVDPSYQHFAGQFLKKEKDLFGRNLKRGKSAEATKPKYDINAYENLLSNKSQIYFDSPACSAQEGCY